MCGIFGYSGGREAVKKTELGCFCLQHRGQESTGISAWSRYRKKGERLISQKRLGNVAHLKEKLDKERNFNGEVALGHVRYGTTGGSKLENAHPIVRRIEGIKVAVVHNGDIVKINADGQEFSLREFKKLLEKDGIPFETESDTEVILHLLARAKGDIITRVREVLSNLIGAFSLLILWDGYLIAARDPWGFRPLWLGKHNGGFVFSSEDYPFQQLKFTPVREVNPGEIIVISPEQEMESYSINRNVGRLYQCSFELVYFARPDSTIFGTSVSQARKKFGRTLAEELISKGTLPTIDKVIPVLDSGATSSLAFAQRIFRERIKQLFYQGCEPDELPEELFPFDFGLRRNHYSGRNFITPGQGKRDDEVDLKHNIDTYCVQGLHIGSGDDSLVRGTTTRKHAEKYRKAGAKSVSTLIFSPPIINSCFYGLDTKKRGELIASKKSIEEIRREIGSDYLFFLSLEGFKKCLGCPEKFCTACFDNLYPI